MVEAAAEAVVAVDMAARHGRCMMPSAHPVALKPRFRSSQTAASRSIAANAIREAPDTKKAKFSANRQGLKPCLTSFIMKE